MYRGLIVVRDGESPLHGEGDQSELGIVVGQMFKVLVETEAYNPVRVTIQRMCFELPKGGDDHTG